jgi:hypothetical protein
MKQLQNEISQISTDLIRNLKIKIISISVLNQYFFENFHFHIKLNLINTKLYLISFLPQFFHLAHAWLALLCLVFVFLLLHTFKMHAQNLGLYLFLTSLYNLVKCNTTSQAYLMHSWVCHDTQHYNKLNVTRSIINGSVVMLSVAKKVKTHYAKCLYEECRGAFPKVRRKRTVLNRIPDTFPTIACLCAKV